VSRVVLTGTGVPVPDPARAGAGKYVELDGVRLQVDAGRGTVMRLVGAMAPPQTLDAVLLRAFAQAMADTHYGVIAEYHADAVDLGAAAARAGVERLVLTHFIPPPLDGVEPFVDEVRHGGFTGELVAGDDLTTVTW
jgi:ribonuclease BN (tRNA processing enzyme)